MAERVLTYPEAAAELAAHIARLPAPTSIERVSLLDSPGRVLAADVKTPRPLPPFDRATRDGFAVRASQIGSALRVIGLLRAGQPPAAQPLQPTEALEIMTGAPLPPGADAVLMVEHAERDGDIIRAHTGRTLNAGDNVVPTGSEAAADATILTAGTHLGAAQIAAAASCGAGSLDVFARPTVAVFATGDELLEPPAGDLPRTIAPHQIYNSNGYSLAAQVRAAGALPVTHAALPDDLEATAAAIHQARHAHLLLFSGGVSMGKFDYVEEALRSQGAQFYFTGAKIQPGKPIVFGSLPRLDQSPQYFFGLPGNPVSTLLTFELFARPLLAALSGEVGYTIPFVSAQLAATIPANPVLTRFLPAHVTHSLPAPGVRLVPWQGSGDLAALARSNAFAVLSPAREFAAGDIIPVLLR